MRDDMIYTGDLWASDTTDRKRMRVHMCGMCVFVPVCVCVCAHLDGNLMTALQWPAGVVDAGDHRAVQGLVAPRAQVPAARREGTGDWKQASGNIFGCGKLLRTDQSGCVLRDHWLGSGTQHRALASQRCGESPPSSVSLLLTNESKIKIKKH